MSARRRKPSSATATAKEWVVGIVSMPSTVIEDGESFQPALLLWLDPVDGLSLNVEVGRPDELSGLAADSLRRTIASAAMGPAGPPARLRTASDELADALRGAFPDIEIVVAATPEIDAAAAGLAEMVKGEGDPGWIGEGLEADAVGDFFEAMAALWRAAPWKTVPGDDALFLVDVEAFDVRDAVAVVIGQMGESFGVVLYHSLADYERYVDVADAVHRDHPRGDIDVEAGIPGVPAHLGLNFDPTSDVTPVRREEREAHGWTLAHEDAFPSLIALEPDLVRCAPNADELALAEALARAFAHVDDDGAFGKARNDDETVARTFRVTARGKPVEVRLRAPVFLDEPAGIDSDAIPEHVYRLKLALESVDDEVTRTVELAGDHTLWDLHDVIQQAFDWDNDHLFSFFTSGKLRDRGSCYVGSPIGDVESFELEDDDPRSVQQTRLDGLGLKPRRVMRYVFDEEHLVRIGVAKVRHGGPGDRGLPRTVESIGEAPPQYD